MNRLLLFLVPDKQATLVAVLMSAVSFLLALLDMFSRDFEEAGLHLNLSVGIMATLFVLKFLGMRATYQVAENAQHELRSRMRKLNQAGPPQQKSEAQERAQEIAQITELAGALKQALTNIASDSPVRPKYEATLELMERISRKGGSRLVALKVLHAAMLPSLKPLRNQRTRCAELPWVKLSGTT